MTTTTKNLEMAAFANNLVAAGGMDPSTATHALAENLGITPQEAWNLMAEANNN